MKKGIEVLHPPKANPSKKQATPGVTAKGMKMPAKAPKKSAGGGVTKMAGVQKPL